MLVCQPKLMPPRVLTSNYSTSIIVPWHGLVTAAGGQTHQPFSGHWSAGGQKHQPFSGHWSAGGQTHQPFSGHWSVQCESLSERREPRPPPGKEGGNVAVPYSCREMVRSVSCRQLPKLRGMGKNLLRVFRALINMSIGLLYTFYYQNAFLGIETEKSSINIHYSF